MISKPRFFLPLIPNYRWLDWQSSLMSHPNKSEDDQPITLTNELKKTQLHLIFIVFWTNSDNFYAQHSQPHCTWLHVTARNCTWVSVNLHQNCYLSTFKSLAWLDLFDFWSLSCKALVFFLKLPLGQEVGFLTTTFYQIIDFFPQLPFWVMRIFHWLIFIRFSSLISCHCVGSFFTSNMTFYNSSAFLRG